MITAGERRGTANPARFRLGSEPNEGKGRPMAERTIVVCDVCGKPATETVTIKTSRGNYAKDLCAQHVTELTAGACDRMLDVLARHGVRVITRAPTGAGNDTGYHHPGHRLPDESPLSRAQGAFGPMTLGEPSSSTSDFATFTRSV